MDVTLRILTLRTPSLNCYVVVSEVKDVSHSHFPDEGIEPPRYWISS